MEVEVDSNIQIRKHRWYRVPLFNQDMLKIIVIVSLFSHEYVHQWNVKRLRPKRFLDYDLQREVNTDLLWWFEGSDLMDRRHHVLAFRGLERRGLLCRHEAKAQTTPYTKCLSCQALCRVSHEAWIHLYRGHAYSRETQISYYLEGELTMFALDAELRKRSKGATGVCDLMKLFV